MEVRSRQIDLPTAIASFVIAGVAVAALWLTREFSAFGSIFPIVVGSVLLLTSLAIGVRCLLGSNPSVERAVHSRAGLRNSILLIALLVLWAISLESVGFIVSSWISFVMLAFIADNEPFTWRRGLLYAIAAGVVVGGLYLLFQGLLNVRLP
jgi:hypothetical protein